MTALVFALFDEAFEFIRQLNIKKKDSYSSYEGIIRGHDVSLFLCRPGFKNKKKFKDWLNSKTFTEVILGGFCGSLSSNFRPGEICHIKEVFSQNQKGSFKLEIEEGQKILTVPLPVLTMEERENLLLHHKTELVDMESFIACDIMKKEFPDLKFHIIKAVGDSAGEDELMKNEIKMRAFFSSFGVISKFKIAFSAGIPFFEIYRRKRLLQKEIFKAIIKHMEERSKNE